MLGKFVARNFSRNYFLIRGHNFFFYSNAKENEINRVIMHKIFHKQAVHQTVKKIHNFVVWAERGQNNILIQNFRIINTDIFFSLIDRSGEILIEDFKETITIHKKTIRKHQDKFEKEKFDVSQSSDMDYGDWKRSPLSWNAYKLRRGFRSSLGAKYFYNLVLKNYISTL